MSKQPWQNRVVGQEERDPATLVPNPDNWRTHPTKQQQVLAGALDEIGWVAPVVVNVRTGHLVDGHLRAALAVRRRQASVPVTLVDLEPEEERLALATLDPLAALADTDQAKLDAILAGLAPSDDALAALLEELTEGGLDEIVDDWQAEAGDRRLDELQTKWGVRQGDIWVAGHHRIACGDALDPALYRRLMAGAKAALVHTDPPYGVSYQSPSGKHDPIANDALTGDGLVDFLAISFQRLVENSEQDAAFYIWHANRDDFLWAMKRAGLMERQTIVWIKPSATLGHADYQQAYEPCFYASRDGQQSPWYGGRDQSTAWQVAVGSGDGKGAVLGNGIYVSDGAGTALWISGAKPKGKKVRTVRLEAGQSLEIGQPGEESTAWFVARDHKPYHPTQKPVELAARAIKNSSKRGDIVLDPFLGAGGTAIAAQTLARACYGIDLEPRYVAVVLERLAEAGLHPAREGDATEEAA